MYTNACCTIYLAAENYEPVFIEECFITCRKTHFSNGKSLTYAESAFVMFHGHEELVFTCGKDWLIKGDCEIVVNTSSEEARSQSLNELKKAGAYTVMAADRMDFGSARMRHWEVSCK